MTASQRRHRILVISQVYVPDPASVGQHMHDAAAELAGRGHDVRVLASANGYDDPSQKYDPKEERDGVRIRRLRFSSFGKKSIKTRLIAQGLYLLQVMLRGLFMGKLDAIVVSTSPPMASIAAVTLARLKGAPITFWAMDLNPDQMIAMGMITEHSLPAKVFNALNKRLLKKSKAVVALDRFMLDRLNRKHEVTAKSHVFPPWPHEDAIEPLDHAQNDFRDEHGLQDKFVVMYSGNHSPANPIGTVIEAARRLSDRDDIVFMFIGGGLQKQEVEKAIENGASNIRSLPYQPMERLRYSLSAADLHVVTVGNEVVGIVHPCKVYGAMAVSRPVLTFGPAQCHLSDIVERYECGRHIAHGEVDAAVDAILALKDAGHQERAAMGERARDAITTALGKPALCGRFADITESTFMPGRTPGGTADRAPAADQGHEPARETAAASA